MICLSGIRTPFIRRRINVLLFISVRSCPGAVKIFIPGEAANVASNVKVGTHFWAFKVGVINCALWTVKRAFKVNLWLSIFVAPTGRAVVCVCVRVTNFFRALTGRYVNLFLSRHFISVGAVNIP